MKLDYSYIGSLCAFHKLNKRTQHTLNTYLTAVANTAINFLLHCKHGAAVDRTGTLKAIGMLLPLAFFCFIQGAKGQYKTGHIRHEYTFIPSEGARIHLLGSDKSVFSDNEGAFDIPKDWTFGEIEISCSGYEALRIELSDGGFTKGRNTFYLKKSSGFLPQLVLGDTLPTEVWDLPLDIYNAPDGRTVSTLRELAGDRLLVLDFWATWCSPCVRSMEHWNHIFPQFKDKVSVIGVHLGRQDKVADFIKSRKWQLPTIVGENPKLLNDCFFTEVQVGQVVLIKDGVFYAALKEKRPDALLLNKLLNDKKLEIETDTSFTYRRKGLL